MEAVAQGCKYVFFFQSVETNNHVSHREHQHKYKCKCVKHERAEEETSQLGNWKKKNYHGASKTKIEK